MADNRIREIREVLSEFDTWELGSAHRVVNRIRAVLDSVPAEQAYEWGWRRTYDKPDDVVIAFSEADARSRLTFLHNAVVVRRPVGPWETVEPLSDPGTGEA